MTTHHFIVTAAKAAVSPLAFGRTGEIPAFAGMTNAKVAGQ